ncbi:MAG: transposase [Kiritimatiellae bacterium]|nr:transposase [Kiritimatiellia bacterium]
MLGIFQPLDRKVEIHCHYRNLPHWQQPFCTYFITYRLSDSLPRSMLEAWTRELRRWKEHHPEPWSVKEWREYQQRFGKRYHAWLDKGYGSCQLKEARLRRIITESLSHFDQIRYALDAYVIMPNHVHILVQPDPGFSLQNILHTWKSYTANQINAACKRSGTFWMDEYFDHAVRSWSQMDLYRTYIHENPQKASLPDHAVTVGRGAGVHLGTEAVPKLKPCASSP